MTGVLTAARGEQAAPAGTQVLALHHSHRHHHHHHHHHAALAGWRPCIKDVREALHHVATLLRALAQALAVGPPVP